MGIRFATGTVTVSVPSIVPYTTRDRSRRYGRRILRCPV